MEKWDKQFLIQNTQSPFSIFLDLSQQALNKWPPGALLLKGSRGNEIEYYAANFILHWGVRGGWGLADLPE